MPEASSRIELAVSNYVAAWNEPDADRRAALLEQAVSDDVRIAVGGREVRGRAALDAEIAEFHRTMPEARGRLSTAIDAHGSVCRFAAVVEAPDGSLLAEMFDACECDASGRLLRIMTFVGASIPSSGDRID